MCSDFNTRSGDSTCAHAMNLAHLMETSGFVQHVESATHDRGNTLDLIITDHRVTECGLLKPNQGGGRGEFSSPTTEPLTATVLLQISWHQILTFLHKILKLFSLETTHAYVPSLTHCNLADDETDYNVAYTRTDIQDADITSC